MARKLLCFVCSALFLVNITLGSSLPDISADGAILIETNTNTILYSKNLGERFYPASTTKILTALAIAQDLPMAEIITKTQESVDNVPSDSSQIGLNVGDQYTVFDGLHAVLMASDNFVCYDLANIDSGSIVNFANKMNTLALSCGANKSNFVNPHGYHDVMHYTTPYSLSQIARHAFSNPLVKEIAGIQSYDFTVANTGKTIKLTHTAALLDPSSTYYNANVVAAKTGYHTPAGRTLVAQAEYDNIDLIAVVMRTDAPLQFEDINKLFAYGSENFTLGYNEETNQNFIINSTYSNWAQPYVQRALDKTWITNTGRNYTTPVTGREFATLLRSSTTCKYNTTLDDMINYNGESIYRENLPVTKVEVAKMIAHYLSGLDLTIPSNTISISDIDTLSPSEQAAIKFCINTNIMSLSENHTFSPNSIVSYEEALCLLSKTADIVDRYHSYNLLPVSHSH